VDDLNKVAEIIIGFIALVTGWTALVWWTVTIVKAVWMG
jgi:hypothetical protein